MNFLKKFLIAIAIVAIVLAGYYKVWFLRLPERNIPHNNSLFMAPANGVIVSIKNWDKETLQETKGELGVINVWTKDVDTAGTIISIQMDPTNVHFQRAPLDGKVLLHKHTKGSFNNAVTMSNEYGIRFENEHNEILLQTTTGKKYKLIQIAGFLARRIVDYVEPEQEVKQGDVIGLIKLGSQVTVILPQGFEVKAKVGETTIDGETILATEK